MEDSVYPSTHSAALIGSNDDLLTEILIRLPASAILRFKSVSNHWRRLLSGKHFTIRYDSLSKSPGLFIGYSYIPFDVENQTTPPHPRCNIIYDPYGIYILQSCNGLMLCCRDRGSEYASKYYVINPTTKQFATVPSVPRGKSVRNSIHSMSLAFHHIDCRQYKVVCILKMDRYKDLFQILVYSSDTRKWKICVESIFLDKPFFMTGVYWNGAIHWCPYDNDGYNLYFRIDTERLQSLPLPSVNTTSDEPFPTYHGESRGHLNLIMTNFHENFRLHNVFEMLSDHSGWWFVKYKVKLDNPLHYTFLEIVDVIRGEKEEDSFMVFTCKEKLMKYKFHDKSFEQLDDDIMYRSQRNFHRYIEKLGSF